MFGALKRFLFGNGSTEMGAASLKAALREQPKGVDLYGVYREPKYSVEGGETAKFPVELRVEGTDQYYGTETVEFPLPEGSIDGAALQSFLDANGLTVETLDEIEGKEVDVRNEADGNRRILWRA